ncbi:MAG: hypothetical protein IKZ59_08425 [Clostridia bacterium]|nr:hypothetical protein [Clostridia bacterium]
MRRKPLFKSAVMIIAIMFVLSLFAGCGEAEDYYGAASDYISVNHTDTDSDSEFLDDTSGEPATDSGQESGNSAVVSKPDGGSSEVNITDEQGGGEQSGDDTQSGDSGNGASDSTDNPADRDDFGRVVDFTNP